MDESLVKIQLIARSLAVDLVSAEVADGFEAEDIPVILLKGPSFVRWLYEDGSARPYGDSDLLVLDDDFVRAERALGEMGFELAVGVEFPHQMPSWDRTWRRPIDGAVVDLHRTLFGIGLAPQAAWVLLERETEGMKVGGRDIRVFNRDARCFHVAVHCAQHGVAEMKPAEDLLRAVHQEPYETWISAARLAGQLSATDAFSGGLRLIPEGTAVADRLGLPLPTSAQVLIRLQGSPHLALGLDHLSRVRGFRAKVVYLTRAFVPSRSSMERTDPRALRGRLGLLLAYLSRWVWMLRSTPRALFAYRRGRQHNR